MSNELLIFTHNDLDAMGCMLNIEFKWPTVEKKYFYTNYQNIDQIVDSIIAHAEVHGNTHLLITDVSFADNKSALTRCYDYFDHVTHIDHHLYPEGFWDCYPKMKVVWDKTKCATLLCNEYFGNVGLNSNLDKLSQLIDIYDIWQTNHPAFKNTMDLNEYFWKHDIYDLCQAIVKNDFKLPPNYLETVQHIQNEYNTAIAGYEENKLIQRNGPITICFINDWFNQVLVSEMEKGQDFVIGINAYGIVRVRIRAEADYSVQEKNKLRLLLTGTENIGHMNAFTFKRGKEMTSFDDLIEEAKFTVNHIVDIMLENNGG